jgi:hypothetical protein
MNETKLAPQAIAVRLMACARPPPGISLQPLQPATDDAVDELWVVVVYTMVLACDMCKEMRRANSIFQAQQTKVTRTPPDFASATARTLCTLAHTQSKVNKVTWQFMELSLGSRVWQRPEQLADRAIERRE